MVVSTVKFEPNVYIVGFFSLDFKIADGGPFKFRDFNFKLKIVFVSK